jgi:hypothetical protein
LEEVKGVIVDQLCKKKEAKCDAKLPNNRVWPGAEVAIRLIGEA